MMLSGEQLRGFSIDKPWGKLHAELRSPSALESGGGTEIPHLH